MILNNQILDIAWIIVQNELHSLIRLFVVSAVFLSYFPEGNLATTLIKELLEKEKSC